MDASGCLGAQAYAITGCILLADFGARIELETQLGAAMARYNASLLV